MNAVFLTLIFAVIALLEKISLRNGIILCTSFILLGSCFKCLVYRQYFWAQIVGQGCVGVANILVTIIPPRVAAVWFSEDELSRAIGTLLSAQVIGNALGLLIPNLAIKSHITLEEEEIHEEFLQEHGITRICTKFERNMRLFFLAHAAVALLLLILVLVFFKNKSSKKEEEDNEEDKRKKFNKKSYTALFRNRNFIILVFVYGISVGVIVSTAALFRPILEQVLNRLSEGPELTSLISRLGFIRTLPGFFGTIALGAVLDSYPYFRSSLSTVLFLLSCCLTAVFVSSSLSSSLVVIYMTVGIYGFFAMMVFPIGFRFGAFLTKGVPETTMAGVLSISNQLFGLVFVQTKTFIIEHFHAQLKYEETSKGVMIGLVSLSLLAFCLSLFISEKKNVEAPRDISRRSSQFTNISEVKTVCK
ncbi:unnamed protein product [Oikopleura dioica]|uniref:Major facilitator superfamily (MFS) profile domain-containing protein n=1 Tax=Oikopleura dioica TaxID=34765 RepID=E4YHX5_OIKDI|nr:unnamed protein product [Oikopleura dioica]